MRRNRSPFAGNPEALRQRTLKDFSKKSPDIANLARGMHLRGQPLNANVLPVVKAAGGLKASHCYL
ncbi:protein of unknown function [Agrobacterium pusense]|uniref:Uncharacterized protein n=1 Tax=Agrobacterium pusense TaxID=648995 RepID=U4QA40_9HYPH|nr:protein of unknown function [Agrobacterium pusense]